MIGKKKNDALRPKFYSLIYLLVYKSRALCLHVRYIKHTSEMIG